MHVRERAAGRRPWSINQPRSQEHCTLRKRVKCSQGVEGNEAPTEVWVLKTGRPLEAVKRD